MDLEGLQQFVGEVQDVWEGARSCATRWSERYPYEVRLDAVWASKEGGPLLQRHARLLHVRRAGRRVWERERLAKLASVVRAARVPERDQALKDIAAVKHGPDVLEGESDMLRAIADPFAQTWGLHRPRGVGLHVGEGGPHHRVACRRCRRCVLEVGGAHA